MSEFANCPKCGTSAAERVKFTWWGGVLGPKLLNHVKCSSCGTRYNGKSGKSNGTGIAIYFAVVGIISFVLLFALAFAYAFLTYKK
jgi:hypothetical protein